MVTLDAQQGVGAKRIIDPDRHPIHHNAYTVFGSPLKAFKTDRHGCGLGGPGTLPYPRRHPRVSGLRRRAVICRRCPGFRCPGEDEGRPTRSRAAALCEGSGGPRGRTERRRAGS
jgi:hypothetical protein